MANDRFLLIKACESGFWANIEHVMSQLLISEITNRIPVVYWETSCLYNGEVHNNAFDMYFEPVSAFTIHDLICKDYTYYPPVWQYDNIMADDPNKHTRLSRNLGDMMESTADVEVSDLSICIGKIIPWIKKDSLTYGMTPIQINRFLYEKYLKLKPDIYDEIQKYFESFKIDDGSILGIHVPVDFNSGDLIIEKKPLFDKLNETYHTRIYKIRRKDKFSDDEHVKFHNIAQFQELSNTKKMNNKYHTEIGWILGKSNIKKIFLITDCSDIVEEYQSSYNSIIISSNSKRRSVAEMGLSQNFENYFNKRSKGIEIIKDTYLASKCDFFIGNGNSYLSHAVIHLKNCPETNDKLLYFLLRKQENVIFKKAISTAKNIFAKELEIE
jgi:hypothetical protein